MEQKPNDFRGAFQICIPKILGFFHDIVSNGKHYSNDSMLISINISLKFAIRKNFGEIFPEYTGFVLKDS